MPGTSILISTASFTHVLASLTLPDISDVVAEYVLGVDAESSRRNRAIGGSSATLVGTPTISQYYALVEGGGGGGTARGFNTGILPAGDATLLTVCKAPASGIYHPLMAIAGGTSMLGFAIGGNIEFANSQWTTAPNLASLSTPSHGNFFFAAGVAPLGQAPKLYLGSGGSLTSNTGQQGGQNPRYTDSGFFMKIGLGDSVGSGIVAYAAVISGVKDQAWIEDAYQSLRGSFYDGKIVVA